MLVIHFLNIMDGPLDGILTKFPSSMKTFPSPRGRVQKLVSINIILEGEDSVLER